MFVVACRRPLSILIHIAVLFPSVRYQSILSDVTVVWMVFSLPVLEPLTPKRLEQVIAWTVSCLYTAVTVATADTIINMVKPATAAQPASKDEEIEGYGRAIVQKSVRITLFL